MRHLAALALLAACGGHDPAPRAPDPEPVEANAPDAGLEEASAYVAVLVGGEEGPGLEDTAPADPDERPRDERERGTGRGSGGGDPPSPDDASGKTGLNAVTAHDESSLRGDDVEQKIRNAYFAGIAKCYKDALKQDPTVVGKLTLTFEVNEKGRTTPTSVTAPTSALGACVEGKAAGWSFSAPEDDDGEPTSAAFTVTFVLSTE